jgi:hypothetical protein
MEAAMERRMSVTPSRAQSAEKSADTNDRTPPAKNQDRTGKPYGSSRIEPQDWRGEGVVGNNHTD